MRAHPVAAVAPVAATGYALVCLFFVGIGLLVTNQMSALTRWDNDVVRWFAQNRTSAITPRVYRGMYHPSDVVAGPFLVFAVLYVAVAPLRAGQKAAEARRRVDAAPPERSLDTELVA